MKTVPEIILGKPVKDWRAKDVWFLRFLTPLVGGLFWLVWLRLLSILHPDLTFGFFFIVSIAIIYMMVLFFFTISAIPMPEITIEKPKGQKVTLLKSTQEKISGAVQSAKSVFSSSPSEDKESQSKRSVIIMLISIFQIIVGAVFLIACLTLSARSLIMNLVWPLLGAGMIVLGVLSILRNPLARMGNVLFQLIFAIGISFPLLGDALRVFTHRNNVLHQFGSLFALLLIWGLCAGIAFCYTRRFAYSHFKSE